MACLLINIKQSQTNMLNVFLIKVSIKKEINSKKVIKWSKCFLFDKLAIAQKMLIQWDLM